MFNRLFAFVVALVLLNGLEAFMPANPASASGFPNALVADEQSSPPMAVIDCNWGFDNASGGDWDITVALSFSNISSKTITDAKFEFRLIDAFGKTLQTETGTVSGTFSPQVEIQPRKGLDGRYFTQPDSNYPSSPAWDVSNFSDNQVKRLECVPVGAAFGDGTTRTAPE